MKPAKAWTVLACVFATIVADCLGAAPATQPTPLQAWQTYVGQHLAAGPYTTAVDLHDAIVAAKAGDRIVCVPGSAHITSTETTIPAGVHVYLNGGTLACSPVKGGSSDLIMEAGSSIDGAHITKGDTFAPVRGHLCSITNCFSDDYVLNKDGTWTGVAISFVNTNTVEDLNTASDFTMSNCWVGITGSVSAYITCNHTFSNVYFVGSIGEYDYRNEVNSGTTIKCQKATVTGCVFMYQNQENKGSCAGVREGNGVTFDRCFFQGNIRIGQVQAPPIKTPGICASNITFTGCRHVALGQTSSISIDEGATVVITSPQFWTAQTTTSIAQDLGNTLTATNAMAHVPPGQKWRLIGDPWSTGHVEVGTKQDNEYAMPTPPFPW